MNHLRPGDAALLERLGSRNPALFRAVPDTTGADRHGSLELTVDSVRRVVDARVRDVDRLRHRDAFIDALQEAFAAADGARALASLELSGRAEEFLARAEETVAGNRPAVAPAPPDVSREASEARRAARVAGPLSPSQRPERPAPATSDNGYLTVQRGADGRLVSVTVDADWLGGAQPHHLERAIVQACRFGTED